MPYIGSYRFVWLFLDYAFKSRNNQINLINFRFRDFLKNFWTL